MVRMTVLALCTSSLIACGTVSIDPSDPTPPTLSLQLLGEDATYNDDGSSVEGAVDFLRRPTVNSGSGNPRFSVLVSAKDEQSGVEVVSISLTLTGVCVYHYLGADVVDDFRVILSGRSDPAVEGGEASVTGITAIGIQPEDIWQRSRCERDSIINDRARGRLDNLDARYYILSRNNAGLETEQNGGFDIESINVNYSVPLE